MGLLERIYVVNKTPSLSDEMVRLMVSAINTQITRDFDIAWNLGPVLVEVGDPPDGEENGVIVLQDGSDVPGALGYHELYGDGRIGGIVDVSATGGIVLLDENDLNAVTVSSVLSHEILETIADETANQWVDRLTGGEVALEVCDPVEANNYVIGWNETTADGQSKTYRVAVSDFVYPAWFDGLAKFDRLTKGDQLGIVKAPLQSAPAGYQIIRDENGVHDVFGERKHVPGMRAWRMGVGKAPGFRSRKRVKR